LRLTKYHRSQSWVAVQIVDSLDPRDCQPASANTEGRATKLGGNKLDRLSIYQIDLRASALVGTNHIHSLNIAYKKVTGHRALGTDLTPLQRRGMRSP
jgi:hypothetical protein